MSPRTDRPTAAALLADLARGYALAEFFPLTHPTLDQALRRLEADLLGMGRELRFAAGPWGLTLGGEVVARGSHHVERFAARLAEHGVGEVWLRWDLGADALGRFLSAVALPPRVARAAGGLAGALSAAGAVGIALDRAWVSPALVAVSPPGEPPAAPGPPAEAAPAGGVDAGITFWSAQDVYEQVRRSAQRVEEENVDDLRRQLREGSDSERLVVLQRLEFVAQWTLEQGQMDRTVALLGELRYDAEHLAGRSPSVRASVMLAIHRLATPPVVEELVAELGRARSEEERAGVRATLLHVGADTVTPLVRALVAATDVSARRAFRDALVALDHVGVPLLEDMVGDERWFVVRNMVGILGEVRSPDALEHFARTIRHDDARVRRETILALPKLGGEEAAAVLVQGLSDAEAGLRAAAALGLGLLKSPAAVAPLVALLAKEPDAEAQVEIVRALGRLGDARAVPALAEKAGGGGWLSLSRQPVALRVEAVRALGEVGGPAAREVLQKLEKDRSAEVREAVGRALG